MIMQGKEGANEWTVFFSTWYTGLHKGAVTTRIIATRRTPWSTRYIPGTVPE